MTAQELRDAIAARAAGEDFPGLAGLDAELGKSEAARENLAALEAVCKLMREATPAPSAVRLAKTAVRPATRGTPWWAWSVAAAVLLISFSIFAMVVRKKANQVGPTPPSHPVAAPGRSPIEDVIADLGPAKPGSPLGANDVKDPQRRMGGGGGSAPPEYAVLPPVADQARGLKALRPQKLPGDAHLVRARVLRAAKDGPPSDALWLRYKGETADVVIVQVAPASKAWLTDLKLPEGWRRFETERHGTSVLVASPDCDEAALRKLADSLEPLHK